MTPFDFKRESVATLSSRIWSPSAFNERVWLTNSRMIVTDACPIQATIAWRDVFNLRSAADQTVVPWSAFGHSVFTLSIADLGTVVHNQVITVEILTAEVIRAVRSSLETLARVIHWSGWEDLAFDLPGGTSEPIALSARRISAFLTVAIECLTNNTHDRAIDRSRDCVPVVVCPIVNAGVDPTRAIVKRISTLVTCPNFQIVVFEPPQTSGYIPNEMVERDRNRRMEFDW